MLHSAPSDLIGVNCYRCSARLYFQRVEAGTPVRCSVCRSTLTVPAAEPMLEPQPRQVEGYTMRAGDVEVPPPIAPAPPPSAGPQVIAAIACPGCRTELRPAAHQANQQMHCPQCGEVVRVPPLLPPVVAPAASAGDNAALEPARPPYLFRPLQSERPEAVAALPPRWTFFSGVFTIAFRRECLLRWFLFSIGLAISLPVTGIVVAMLTQGGMLGALGAGFMALGALWISLWTLSYGAASFVAILGDTANGGDEIASWPDDDWREWIFQLLLIVPALGISLALGALFGELWNTFAPGTYLVTGSLTMLIFPVVMLSSFAQNHPLQPFSATVWKSLGREAAAWGIVWGLSLLLILPLTTALWLAETLGVTMAILLIAPYAAAAWFTYARLLGRLLWKIHQSADPEE